MTAEELIAKLPIVSENIIYEAANMPIAFVRAAEYRVVKMKHRHQATARLEAAKAKLALIIRGKKSNQGERRITEGGVKERTERHPVIRKLRAENERAIEAEELGKLIVEAYRERRDAIRVIAEAQNLSAIREDAEVTRIQKRSAIVRKARVLDQRRQILEAKEDGESDEE